MPIGVVDLVEAAAPTFPDMLQALYRQKYTGSITIQLIHGVPTVIEIPEKPTQIRLRVPPRT